ncbi:hypothetical protein TWF506_008335 [Arthrobotrys conoides]|uniref:Uncharacterized protein n=1 Tax=Arthrobotrys conoides TaxID=74498 RepID=A0AAN8RMN1_9PEZI
MSIAKEVQRVTITQPARAEGLIGLFGHCEICVRDSMGTVDGRIRMYMSKAELDEHKATHSLESIKNRAIRPWPASVNGFQCPVKRCDFTATLADGYLGLWRHIAGEHESHFRETLLL